MLDAQGQPLNRPRMAEQTQRLERCNRMEQRRHRQLWLLVFGLFAMACNPRPPQPPRRRPANNRRRLPVPKVQKKTARVGVPATIVAELLSPERAVHFARNGAHGLLLARGSRQVMAGPVEIAPPTASANEDEPKRELQALSDIALDALVAADRHGKTDFAVAYTKENNGKNEVRVVLLSPQAKARAAASTLFSTHKTIAWLQLFPGPQGTFVVWQTTSDGKKQVHAALRTGPGAWSSVLSLPPAVAWHATATQKGLAFVQVLGASEGKGSLRLDLVDVNGGALRHKHVALGSQTSMSDAQIAHVNGRVVVAWTDARERDQHIYYASASLSGKILAAPAPARERVGSAGLHALVASADKKRALIAYELVQAQPRSQRLIGLLTLDSEGRLDGQRAEMVWENRNGNPHFVADGDGFAGITFATPRRRSSEDVAGPVSPSLIRFSPDLGVRGAEPIHLEAYRSRRSPAGLPAWVNHLRCEEGLCTALASSAGKPALLSLIRLPRRVSSWRSPAKRLARSKPPRARWLKSLAHSDAAIADIASARLDDGRLLVAWITHFTADGRQGPAPAGAELSYRFVHPDGSLSPVQILSKKAISIGGVSVTAVPSLKLRGRTAVAAIAWAGPHAKSSHVFATLIDSKGKKLRQRTVTKVRREQKRNRIPNQVFDVTLRPDGRGNLLVAWADSRDGNLEIYAARLNKVLEKNIIDRRITRSKSPSSEVQLVVTKKSSYLLWSEAKTAKSKAAIRWQKLSTEGLRKQGKAQSLWTGKEHVARPQLLAMQDGSFAAFWIEQATGDSPSALRLVQLDDQGKALTALRRVRPQGDSIVHDGSLSCSKTSCRGLLTSSSGDQAQLEAFALTIAHGAPVMSRRIARLAGPSEGLGHLLIPQRDAAFALFSQQLGQETLLRNVLLQWEP